MGFFGLFKKKNKFKKLSKKDKEIEKYFNEGSIVLPTDIRDYENIELFKEKVKNIPSIYNRLKELRF